MTTHRTHVELSPTWLIIMAAASASATGCSLVMRAWISRDYPRHFLIELLNGYFLWDWAVTIRDEWRKASGPNEVYFPEFYEEVTGDQLAAVARRYQASTGRSS